MKTLYLECGMGAAGDMLMAALLELIPARQAFLDQMNGLGLPGVHIAAEKVEKCGITGTQIRVTVHGEEEVSEDVPTQEHSPEQGHEHSHAHQPEEMHHHDHFHDAHSHDYPHEQDHEHAHEDGHHHDHDRSHAHHHISVREIEEIMDGLAVSGQVKADAKAVYALIAEAESQAHGRPVDQIHFHEVGTLDAVADVVGVCLLMEKIGAEKIAASPVHVGSGYVRCMHGVLPVPAPATAWILRGVPTYGGQVQGELCTPTGAALLKHFVSDFGDRPIMSTEAIGYGMGQKEFERANCVRAFLGESDGELERIVRLECNLDDMTGEAIGFAMDQLFSAGAWEVYTQPVGMKKSRPGVMLSVICSPDDAEQLASLMMKHTTTLGVRRENLDRYALMRRVETVKTPYGPVRVKVASGMGVRRWKAEYEDLARLARENDASLEEIRQTVKENSG